jgi:hypothetical protein
MTTRRRPSINLVALKLSSRPTRRPLIQRAAHPEIDVKLRLVRRQDRGNGLDLQNDLTGHDDIGAEPVTDAGALVRDRNGSLPLERYPGLPQFVRQALLVHRFQ